MSIFDAFLDETGLKRQRERGQRSVSDVRVSREVELQDRLREHPEEIAKIWPSEADDTGLAGFDYAEYCKAFRAAMARPVRLHVVQGQPFYAQARRLKAIIEETEFSKQWQEKQRGL